MTLLDHLQTGTTTICRAWSVTRRDGVVYGFTDHDLPLSFGGIDYLPDSGLTAKSLDLSTGLSVDNTEAVGVLSATYITEADITAGRYDGAEVRFWQVNWADPSQYLLRFSGTIGEITRSGPQFQAELRGLTEALNLPMGRVYQRDCAALLGDADCGFDTSADGFRHEGAVLASTGRSFRFAGLTEFDPGWFERGRLTVLSGEAKGQIGLIKVDRYDPGDIRVIETWTPVGGAVAAGDLIRVEAGCDRSLSACRYKFGNVPNFRGFPDIPGQDWLISTPLRAGVKDGGSLRS